MRCIFAPPHHCVVPSPYEQGESAVRMVAVLCTLKILYIISILEVGTVWSRYCL